MSPNHDRMADGAAKNRDVHSNLRITFLKQRTVSFQFVFIWLLFREDMLTT